MMRTDMKAIIFDFDGTILDTEHPELAAWQFIYSGHNKTLPIDQWQKRISLGAANFDPMDYLESILGTPLDREAITKRRREKLSQLIADLRPLNGIKEWLIAAHEAGLLLAIASNSPKYWVTSHLQRVDLLKYFDVIITREDVKRLKPDPDVYEIVLEKLKVSASEALAIEDSPVGARAAVAAGLHCLIVPNALTLNLDFPKTFRTINNLGEFKLSEIIAELNNKHSVNLLC
jgi:HAD superfamily hydrolase (TIGR01509 family)